MVFASRQTGLAKQHLRKHDVTFVLVLVVWTAVHEQKLKISRYDFFKNEWWLFRNPLEEKKNNYIRNSWQSSLVSKSNDIRFILFHRSSQCLIIWIPVDHGLKHFNSYNAKYSRDTNSQLTVWYFDYQWTITGNPSTK